LGGFETHGYTKDGYALLPKQDASNPSLGNRRESLKSHQITHQIVDGEGKHSGLNCFLVYLFYYWNVQACPHITRYAAQVCSVKI